MIYSRIFHTLKHVFLHFGGSIYLSLDHSAPHIHVIRKLKTCATVYSLRDLHRNLVFIGGHPFSIIIIDYLTLVVLQLKLLFEG